MTNLSREKQKEIADNLIRDEILKEHSDAIISPEGADTDNFKATYVSRKDLGDKGSLFVFKDQDGNSWDCEYYDVDAILINGEEVSLDDMLETKETVDVFKMEATIRIRFDGPIQMRHMEELEEAGLKRASEMMQEGYRSGELNEYIRLDAADGEDGSHYTGWFEIETKEIQDEELFFNTDQDQETGMTGAMMRK